MASARANTLRQEVIHPGDTIFALSSGAPPARVSAVVRVSGPAAGRLAEALAGPLRRHRAGRRALRRVAAAGDLINWSLLLSGFRLGEGSLPRREISSSFTFMADARWWRGCWRYWAAFPDCVMAGPGGVQPAYCSMAASTSRGAAAADEALSDLLLARRRRPSAGRYLRRVRGSALGERIEALSAVRSSVFRRRPRRSLDYSDEEDVTDRRGRRGLVLSGSAIWRGSWLARLFRGLEQRGAARRHFGSADEAAE